VLGDRVGVHGCVPLQHCKRLKNNDQSARHPGYWQDGKCAGESLEEPYLIFVWYAPQSQILRFSISFDIFSATMLQSLTFVVFVLSSLLGALGKQVKHEMTLTWESGAPNGQARELIKMNGQFPGPAFIWDEDDDIEVN
jgi:hypothetical protein